jgi:hypothetical protein
MCYAATCHAAIVSGPHIFFSNNSGELCVISLKKGKRGKLYKTGWLEKTFQLTLHTAKKKKKKKKNKKLDHNQFVILGH